MSQATIRNDAVPTMARELPGKARIAAAWAVLDKWVTRVITVLVFVVLARLLTPYELGIAALALVVRNGLGVFVDQGFTEAILQAPMLGRRLLNTAFWTAITTGCLLTLGMIGLAPFIGGEVLGDRSVVPLLQVLGLSLFLTALSSTQSALLQRDLAFRELAIRRIIAQIVAGTAAIVAAVMGAGAWSIVLQAIVQGAVGAAILWRYSRWRPRFEFDRAALRSLWVFGVSVIGIDVLTVIQQQGDNFLVGRSLGAAALGIYALAFRFYFVAVDMTVSSISSVALSTLSRLQTDPSTTQRVFLSATRVVGLVTIPIFTGMFLVAPEMISALVGEGWSAAAPVLRALCPSGLILCLAYLDRSLIIALGRPRLALGVTAVGVALRVVGYVVGVRFGVVGVAVGLSVASIVYWPFRSRVVAKLTGASIAMYFRRFTSAVAATVVMVPTVVLTRAALRGDVSAWALLGAEVLTGTVTYVATLLLVDRASVRELIGLIGLLLRRRDPSSAPREGSAGRLFTKVRQNWHWGTTHGWRDLVEEHDANPLVRARRAARKNRYRRTTPDRGEPAKPIFLVGAQRSGTNMIAHGLDEAPEFEVYNEGHIRAFDNFRLRPLPTIASLIERSPSEFVLFKPLCDSHRAREFLDHFQPTARVIWAYRDVEGRTRSALAKFGDSNLRVLRAYAVGDADDAWQIQGISAENAAFIRSLDLGRLSAASGAALFWYIRNSLYFEMGLHDRSDTMLVSYDRFVTDPERVARTICAFIGLPYRSALVAHIRARPPAWTEPITIDDAIRERCAALQARMDEVSLVEASGPVGR